MNFNPRQALRKLWSALEIPTPNPPELISRLRVVERHIVLPAKAIWIWVLFQSFLSSPWRNMVTSEPGFAQLSVTFEFIQYFFWFYIALNISFAPVIIWMDRVPLALIQWGIFAISLVDGLFVAMLMLITGGPDSILFWVLVALIVRNALSMPPTISQMVLNLAMIVCYIVSVGFALALAENLDEDIIRVLGLTSEDASLEPVLLRVMLLLLLTVCCYGLEILLERQHRQLEEAREFGAREGQLRSAGRIAAEFAHQIKNPLAIINNTLFSLQRALKENRGDAAAQIEIIREEIARSDRIITQVMDYAQLTEGRVEKLNLIEEMNRAITQVFPEAVSGDIKIERQFASNLPPLFMQQRHFSEILVNLLQNAREAIRNEGTVTVRAETLSHRMVQIAVSDTGAGIPSDKLERVFEAYYTTKEKGSGLGLAIVKHNVELYGGTVRAKSSNGKGAQFVLELPAKTLLNAGAEKNLT